MPEGVDDELEPGQVRIGGAGLQEDGSGRIGPDVVARGEVLGPLQKDEGQARALVRRQLADGELLVLRREEAALARVVGVDLRVGSGVVEAQPLRSLHPDAAGFLLGRRESRGRVDLRERGGVRGTVAVSRRGLREQLEAPEARRPATAAKRRRGGAPEGRRARQCRKCRRGAIRYAMFRSSAAATIS